MGTAGPSPGFYIQFAGSRSGILYVSQSSLKLKEQLLERDWGKPECNHQIAPLHFLSRCQFQSEHFLVIPDLGLMKAYLATQSSQIIPLLPLSNNWSNGVVCLQWLLSPESAVTDSACRYRDLVRLSCQAWERITPLVQVKEESVFCSWGFDSVSGGRASHTQYNNEEIFKKLY